MASCLSVILLTNHQIPPSSFSLLCFFDSDFETVSRNYVLIIENWILSNFKVKEEVN